MSRPVARLGDKSNHGGIIISGAHKTLVNGRPVARMGDKHLCPWHGVTPIVSGSAKTLVEGCPIARIGDSTACGAIIITGSPNVLNG